MSIYPEIIAGYEAAVSALAEHAVSIKDPRVLSTFPTDPMEMIRSGPAAYSVYGVLRRDSIYLERTGRFGFDEESIVVDFPVPHTDPDFAERFAEVLVPAAEGLLARAMERSHVERAALSGKPVEAWEAVTELGES
jgi:hypothetical protein